ncbi:MAG TPA: tRNA (adenosine(37)-N6)-dimethylallyltransferase MiaA [Firmicutes bacterium]|nr:tRNA (adenosine(37)-N6)-dimethylallyltransferase MiaA [Bacillota bacterium]
MPRGRLLAIVGPTAVGKSEVAVEVARIIDGEIVSADSMQVYRGLDIGTGKLSPAERGGVPHHLLDVVEPEETYSVARYEREALAAIAAIHRRGRVPLLVGGTGLYYRAVVRDYLFEGPGADPELRARLADEAQREGAPALHRRLAEIDPVAAGRIHPNDLRRIIRALEVYILSGVPLSQQQQGSEEPRFDLVAVGLTAPRGVLYARIERRVDAMLAKGLLAEVRTLVDRGLESWLTSIQALGYKEFLPYLRGEEDLATAVVRLKRETRRYAKRQLTWFRREPHVHWLDREAYPGTGNLVAAILRLAEQAWGTPGPGGRGREVGMQ